MAAKKVLNIISKVFTWIIIAFTIITVVFTLVTVSTVGDKKKNDAPSVFGYKFYIVLSDSMSKSELNAHMKVHFNAGDLIVVKEVADKSTLKEGDIIAFKSFNNEDEEAMKVYGKTITHMIREVQRDEKGNILGFKTFGTNKNKDDHVLVLESEVLGQYVTHFAILGHIFAFIKSVPGYIVCILVPFLILILYNGINIIRLFRKYRREQLEAMNAEKAKIEEERAETQRMMQELLALKAQLDQKNNENPPTDTPASEEDKDAE